MGDKRDSERDKAALDEARRKILRVVHSRFDLELSIPYDFSLTMSSDYDGLVRLISHRTIGDLELPHKPASVAQVRRTISSLFANLLRSHLQHSGYFIAISLRPKSYPTTSRYNSQQIGYDNQRRVLEWFTHTARYATTFEGFQNPTTKFARTTRVIATERLIGLLTAWGSRKLSPAPLSLFSVKQSGNFECIRLRGKKDGKKRPALIEYTDTKETTAMRERLQEWNRFLERQWADLWATDEEFAALPIEPASHEANEDVLNANSVAGLRGVDLTRRQLYRVFNNGTFEEGGRFYGGWWQHIPSAWRSHVTINGHACRELDYSNIQPAMLYAMAGERLDGYAYDIPGIAQTKHNKSAVKTTFFKLIYARKKQRVAPLTRAELPDGWTWSKLREAVEARHAPIAKYLRSGIAPVMQRKDSDIAEDVMLAMMKRNILVLPVHDSFIVRSGYYLALRDEMLRAYGMAMKSRIKLTIDLSYLDTQPKPANLADRVSSTLEDFRAALQKGDSERQGPYRGYYARQSIFRALQPREYSRRFDPA